MRLTSTVPAADPVPERALTQPPQPDIPSPVGAPMPISAQPAAGMDRSILVTRYNRWRERYNPLRGLSISKAVTLLESYQRGEMADPQWTYFFVEQSDADLFAILERREAALLELDWNVKLISGRWGKDDPRQNSFDQKLAEDQGLALREAYENIDNLYEAASHLQLATFRGYSHCEKYRNPDGSIYHLELVDQWNMVRDLLRGRWKYNPAAIQTTFYNLPADLLVQPEDFLIRERDRHVNRLALIKFIRANLCDKDWDAFIEIYGIPSGVVIGPPNVPSGREAEYAGAAERIAQGGNGYLPYLSDYKANDQPRGVSPFRPRLDYLSEKLVLAGTGGLLTMLAQSGSGTLAGGAHMEAFQSIARAEARKISEVFQFSIDREVLDREFPGKPRLTYFEIAANDELDPDKIASQALAYRQAGYAIPVEELSEKSGYNLYDAPLPEKIDVRNTQNSPDELAADERAAKDLDPGGLKNRALTKPGPDHPLAGKLMARARQIFPQAVAKDMAPLRNALAEILQGNDATMLSRAEALYQKLGELGLKIIESNGSEIAIYKILSTALAEGMTNAGKISA
jgi:phage gp29-like protein